MICSSLSCQKSFPTQKFCRQIPYRLSRQIVEANSSPNNLQSSSTCQRRQTLLLGSICSFGLIQNVNQKAFALIPDDDDEELIERAKAKRQSRLQEQKEVQREFITSEGLKDKSVSEDVALVQKTVIKLAKSGDALESGDAKTASDVLQPLEWLDEFKNASQKLSLTPSQKVKAESAIEGLNGLVGAGSSSDLVSLKKQYVAAVDAVQLWCQEAGLSAIVKGL
eukprot:TRINITY_DN1854_c0_g1_i2.p1 TRINITY_DN1854_c0_g1~~TRINITY_DN1854_c0_g1_i2.p1  ORF type:complete len:223 (+),score=30.70 TRINITY_DN1854_c0_g1_i2:98-766(+)